MPARKRSARDMLTPAAAARIIMLWDGGISRPVIAAVADVDLSEFATRASQRSICQPNEAFGDSGPMHQVAGKNKKWNGHQGKDIHAGRHLLERNHQWNIENPEGQQG